MVIKFTKKEFAVVSITLLGIMLATYLNLLTSFRRARDVQRKGDLGAIANALSAYQIDIASYPASEDGKIVACLGGFDENNVPQRRACEWRIEGLRDIFYEDPNYPAYINTLPGDPHYKKGVEYVYLSNGRHFQILSALEGEDEPEFNPQIVARNIMCGTRVCNFGLADGQTPLEKSIEEYENELRMKKLKELDSGL